MLRASLWISLTLHGAAGLALMSWVLTRPEPEEIVELSGPVSFQEHTPAPAASAPALRDRSIEEPAVPFSRESAEVSPVFREIIHEEQVLLPPTEFSPAPEEPLEDLPKKPSPLRIAERARAVSEPRALANPKPDYPSLARRRGYQGEVVIRVIVSPAGKCRSASIVSSSGYSILDEAALEAVQGWSFEPAKQGDQPVEGSLDIPFSFRLS